MSGLQGKALFYFVVWAEEEEEERPEEEQDVGQVRAREAEGHGG